MTQAISRAEENRLFEWLEATAGKPWDSLSEIESTAWRAYLFELQVANGGFHQALLNDGDKWADTLRALHRIEATKIAQMFKDALTVFPGSAPSSEHKTRYEQMWVLDKNALDLLWRLTGEYYELFQNLPGEDFYAKLFAFLKRERIIE